MFTVVHIFNLDGKSYEIPPDGTLTQNHLPLPIPFYTNYTRVGYATALVQSFALLEVVHVLLGWVRSPLVTTVMQVSSRLFLVWGVVERFDETHTNPLFTTMVFAWSLTEVIRYSFYALGLLGSEPKSLLYFRYTTFYVLYPLGAGSEAFLNFSTLPKEISVWNAYDWFRAMLFLIWWPGLYIMYTHMIKQRRKVFGGGRKGSKKD
ncbi:protein tyrosine phosphatase [Moniliophthora roreri MCA 2997]|nr:protein tyrosine phosphatase [Moniliophthora roreri MCA 2997]